MTERELNINSDDDGDRLYIDESVTDIEHHKYFSQYSHKTTTTENPFTLDLNVLSSKYRVRASQTVLITCNVLHKRQRSSQCNPRYYATHTKETSTTTDIEDDKKSSQSDIICISDNLSMTNQ
ncbi:unnamed protein product [Didymodactylos carnosus]|uniref:Uncharacterized protein n=1 Tax=Didymodactylos carnosus TaxID=1234261 RepID=A0A814RH18_9BILA|nr:unnamed protein product [Didymodactylos carnosus]CAF1133339.1 unnamed protein product [Didymodactylos carnosus]CAF3718465.1 unnamed protein product [Didymodactylos carnosus]CAF3897148.1 unnamed protein product [Didymodactylos carnosus]